jgi:hypothetical protein
MSQNQEEGQSFPPLERDPGSIRGFDFPLTASELAVAIFLTLNFARDGVPLN